VRGLGALALAVSSVLAALHERPAPGLTLTTLDVGHGDALALRLPDGTRVLIDTGGKKNGRSHRDPNRQLAERVLVPALRAAGFSSIDLLVLTHADIDHLGAALALSERLPIRALWLSPCARSTALLSDIVSKLTAQGTAIYDAARTAPFAYGGTTFEILGPAPDVEREDGCSVSENDAALVLRVSYAGKRILLSADIEAVAEAELLTRYGQGLAVDVLKVPHHGSRTSSTEAFLDAVDPTIAIVSGVIGRRPPPHAVILERYRARGIATFLTGAQGAVTTHISPDGLLEVDTMKP